MEKKHSSQYVLAVAMVSNPWKPKKQVAAPAMIPLKPKGKNPPDPALSRILGSISSGLICQLWKSAVFEFNHYLRADMATILAI